MKLRRRVNLLTFTSASNAGLVTTISSLMRVANSCGSDRMRSAVGYTQLQFKNHVYC
jgi:hypothetical protein